MNALSDSEFMYKRQSWRFWQFPHFLRESGLRTLRSMCCLRWSRLEIWFFHVFLVSDSLLLCVSVSAEEHRNIGLYLEMFERLGSLRSRTAGVHGWLQVAAIETAVSKQTPFSSPPGDFIIIITLDHNTGRFRNEIDLTGSVGLDGMQVDNIVPARLATADTCFRASGLQTLCQLQFFAFVNHQAQQVR